MHKSDQDLGIGFTYFVYFFISCMQIIYQKLDYHIVIGPYTGRMYEDTSYITIEPSWGHKQKWSVTLLIRKSNFQIMLYAKDSKSINTLRLRQNGRHFTDDLLKCIFLNENVCLLK